jgi:hypothetical protein
MRRLFMAATQEDRTNNISKSETVRPEIRPDAKIDRTAPAGSENSLGAESVRGGRPATDDDVVEAIDEATPGAAE